MIDFESLRTVEDGRVTLYELVWPPAVGPEDPASCVCYIVMKRPGGFLCCLPQGFFSEEEVNQGMAAEANGGLGPSTTVLAKSVSLDEEGEWGTASGSPEVPALVIDLPAAFASALTFLDFSDFGGLSFVEEDFSLVPLAADVLLQARDWVAIRSGYQTGVSEPRPRQQRRRPRSGKPSQASPLSRQP